MILSAIRIENVEQYYSFLRFKLLLFKKNKIKFLKYKQHGRIHKGPGGGRGSCTFYSDISDRKQIYTDNTTRVFIPAILPLFFTLFSMNLFCRYWFSIDTRVEGSGRALYARIKNTYGLPYSRKGRPDFTPRRRKYKYTRKYTWLVLYTEIIH